MLAMRNLHNIFCPNSRWQPGLKGNYWIKNWMLANWNLVECSIDTPTHSTNFFFWHNHMLTFCSKSYSGTCHGSYGDPHSGLLGCSFYNGHLQSSSFYAWFVLPTLNQEKNVANVTLPTLPFLYWLQSNIHRLHGHLGPWGRLDYLG
jgi:hypothetical protein